MIRTEMAPEGRPLYHVKQKRLVGNRRLLHRLLQDHGKLTPEQERLLAQIEAELTHRKADALGVAA